MTASLARPRLEMSLTWRNGPGAGAGVTGGRREGCPGLGFGGTRQEEEAGRAAGVQGSGELAPGSADTPGPGLVAGGGVAFTQGDLRGYV